jgi:hypothetical protein
MRPSGRDKELGPLGAYGNTSFRLQEEDGMLRKDTPFQSHNMFSGGETELWEEIGKDRCF